MPEGDTILWAATRMRPVLEGHVPDARDAGQAPGTARLAGPGALARAPGGPCGERIDTHGKNLFLRFEGDLVLHSHLRMTGSWGVYAPGARWRRVAAPGLARALARRL